MQTALTLLAWLSFVSFIPCDLGHRMSSNLWEINDSMDQYDWYLYPEEILKMLPMILMGVQKPVEVEGFGSFKCNRESFQKVCSIDWGNSLISTNLNSTSLFSIFPYSDVQRWILLLHGFARISKITKQTNDKFQVFLYPYHY